MTADLTRRQLIGAGLAGGVSLAGLDWAKGLHAALAAPRVCGDLRDIEHVVIFIQENRSFDHYFGTYRGVRGFSDPHPQLLPDGSGLNVFFQPGYDHPGYGGHLLPFHLDSFNAGECPHDITHDWGPQHRCWNGGAMDGFVRTHLEVDGADYGPLTMAYHTRADVDYYHALADAFTLCDNHHCSVLGPTDCNQLYLLSATIDPAGRNGGPLLHNAGRLPGGADREAFFGSLTWTTMPEQLRARGVSWKAYSGDNFSQLEDSPLPLFKQFVEDPDLRDRGLRPVFPTDFQQDVANGTLPQVSWIWTHIALSDHPPGPSVFGEQQLDLILQTLTAKPDLWRKTALIVTWDENGGFFDHVPPPTPPPGTTGEYVSVDPLPDTADGVRGPIGLGFRVPLLVVSPYARGGFVCSDVFDHTSILRFLERRFGAEVPNLSAWRRATTGDLTAAFNFAAPDASVPALPRPSLSDPRITGADCVTGVPGLTGAPVPAYPVPPNRMPTQEAGVARRPSGLECAEGSVRRGAIHLTVSPASVPVGRRTRFAFRATTAVAGRAQPVAGATITFAGRRTRTDSRGRATIVVALPQRRRYVAVARKAGLTPGRAGVGVRTARPRVRRRRRASFTG
jgi:phospholipase C